MANYRCLHTRGYTICLLNTRIEQVDNPEAEVGQPSTKPVIRCGMASFSAGLSAPMALYDFDTEQYVGRVEIPDEVRGAMIPQSFCDPEDELELDLVRDLVREWQALQVFS